MGWMQRILEKTGISNVVTVQQKTLHVHELIDWLDAQKEQVITSHKLVQELSTHVNALKNQRWLLQCKLDEWKQQGNQPKAEMAEHLIHLLNLPESGTIDQMLELHGKVERVLEPVIGDGEVHPEFEQVHELQDQFEQKVIQSGYSKIKTLLQRAAIIDQVGDEIHQLQQQVQVRKEKLAQIGEKRNEKQAALASLQQHSAYATFALVKDERQKLLIEIEKAESLQQKFELKERLHHVEKHAGGHDFALKMDDAYYRLEHFSQQASRLQEDLAKLEDALQEKNIRRQREVELFTNITKISLGKEIKVAV